MESKGSESSSAHSEEYEIVGNKTKELDEPKMEGDVGVVKQTMDECLDDQGCSGEYKYIYMNTLNIRATPDMENHKPTTTYQK